MYSLSLLIFNPELLGAYLLDMPISVECWHTFLRYGIALQA